MFKATQKQAASRFVIAPTRARAKGIPYVLVVDDDPRYLELVKFALESAGFNVGTSTEPRSVHSLAIESKPAAIVLDISMPEMDGFEVAANLRADPRTAHIPVLFLTARSAEGDRIRGMRTGAVAYLTKPFSPTVLIDTLRSVMKEVVWPL